MRIIDSIKQKQAKAQDQELELLDGAAWHEEDVEAPDTWQLNDFEDIGLGMEWALSA